MALTLEERIALGSRLQAITEELKAPALQLADWRKLQQERLEILKKLASKN
jgi:hypothetical protein